MSRIAGIAGQVASGARLRAMCLAQRGASPAVSGWAPVTAEGVCCVLGFLGSDPGRCYQAADIMVVLDGQVYNRGSWSSAGGDAGLVAELYRNFGFEGAVSRLNGDFAVALHDRRTGQLWLARDRIGIKPLYYTVLAGGSVAFASRPRALWDLLPGGPHPDPAYVARFAGGHYRIIDQAPDRSPFVGISQLPAGCLASVDGTVAVRRYWELHDGDVHDSEDALAGKYRDLLLDAVSLRLAGPGNRAFSLSGGMDSSSVLACAVRASGSKQRAFSSVYADRTYDESEDIRSILGDCVSRWEAVAVDNPDVPVLVGDMVAVHDEPVATATWLAHFVLCGAAAGAGVTRMFGGLGGDELNAGEYEHFFYFFADLIAGGDQPRLDREIASWVAHHNHPVYQKDRAVVDRYLAAGVDPKVPGRCFGDIRKLRGYRDALRPDFREVLDRVQPVADTPFRSYLKGRTWLDMLVETIPCCVRAEDRQGAAFGVEHILPFFDHRLVELMFAVPTGMKYRDGVTKNLLRRAMTGIVPEPTRTRIKKTGWNAPAHLWFTGKGAERIRDVVRSGAFRAAGVYDPAAVERLLAEHEDIVARGLARDNHMMFFWQLMNLCTWFELLEGVRRHAGKGAD